MSGESLSRRQFLAGFTLCSAVTPGLMAQTGPASIPLGAVIGGAVLQDARPETKLKVLADAGYREVEAQLDQLVKFAPAIADAGLQSISAFIRTPIITGNWALWRSSSNVRGQLPPEGYNLEAALADARQLSALSNLTVVILLPEEARTLDDYRRFADQMSRASEQCRRAGFTLSYHPHSFEYAPLGGQLPVDLLLERFQNDHVKIELDLFWMQMGGRDPVQFIRRNGDRISGLHLKDRSKNAPVRFTGFPWKMGLGARVPVGAGTTNFRDVLEAAHRAGVRHCFVEDESEGDRFENLIQSARHLKSIRS